MLGKTSNLVMKTREIQPQSNIYQKPGRESWMMD